MTLNIYTDFKYRFLVSHAMPLTRGKEGG
jgi:hypothetical protein